MNMAIFLAHMVKGFAWLLLWNHNVNWKISNSIMNIWPKYVKANRKAAGIIQNSSLFWKGPKSPMNSKKFSYFSQSLGGISTFNIINMYKTKANFFEDLFLNLK